MLTATIALAITLGAEANAASPTPAFLAARVDTTRLLDAMDLAPVRWGVRGPGPTRYGMHYWVDPEYSNNLHGVHFVVIAVLSDTAEARAHYDRLRAGAGHPPLSGDEAARDRFAIRFNPDADATDVTLTRGNVYIAFRASGAQEGIEELAETLLASLGDPLIAPQGEPEPLPALTLTQRPGRGNQIEILSQWEGASSGEPPDFVLYHTDGEYIAMADAHGTAEVGASRFEGADELMVAAGREDGNRWKRWVIPLDSIAEHDTDE